VNKQALRGKKILIVGMAGTGKTFVSQFLNHQGIAAFDGDEVEGLSGWFDKSGLRVLPRGLISESLEGLEWNWDQQILKNLLKKHQHEGVLLFGVSSNWHQFLNLFDKVFFLDLDDVETRKRLQSKDRKNEYAQGKAEIDNIVKHLDGFRKFALEQGALPLDAGKSPQEIYEEIISKI
jgi:hypothetical protein